MRKTIQIVLFFSLLTLGTFPQLGFAYSRSVTIQAESVLAYTNAERYKRGLPLLSSNSKLSNVALQKMRDLFAREYFDHVSPTGETVSDLAKDNGYEYIVVGENLALGDFTSSKHVVEAWMDSKGHRENILADKFSEIGIAAGRGMYEGRNTWIVVQSFGHPKSACPSISTTLEEKINYYEQRLQIYERVADIRRVEAERRDGTRTQVKARVEAYNLVARMYNATAEKYRVVVEEYNEGVGGYNECLRDIVGKD